MYKWWFFPLLFLWKVAKGNQSFEPELCEAGFFLLQPRVYLVVADGSLQLSIWQIEEKFATSNKCAELDLNN